MQKISGIFERPKDSGIHWILYRDADGRRRREKVGKLQAALNLLAERRAEVRRGDFIPPRQARAWTFKRLADEAIKHKALRLASLTIETDMIRLGKLAPVIGTMRFDRLTPERIDAVLAGFKREGLTNSTLNRYRSFISSVFKHAVNTGKLSANPVAKVGRFKENDSRLRWLRPEEEKRLRLEFVVDSQEWEFDLALHTGMRRGEQFNLRWKDIDVDRGILTVKGKTGRRHVVANQTAIKALRNLQILTGEEEFVCPDNDGSGKRDGRRWLENAAKKAGIRDFHWHDIRHTFASRLVMAGVDIRTVQELLGHKSIVMTMRYAHLSSDHRNAAVAKMNPDGSERDAGSRSAPHA